MSDAATSRDELAAEYLDTLPYEPYPVQEEALLAYFTSDAGVLVCAPTGTGKTLIAEAAVYEALRTGTKAYYTTPLIALTDQKLQELQESAVRWGFRAEDIGLVTGNRRVNPDATVLVVVAEILLNRLMHSEAFDFSDVGAVVMDEFHSFNDRERGIVWEFSLGLLPKSVRLLLLSATVGNSVEFVGWLARSPRSRCLAVGICLARGLAGVARGRGCDRAAERAEPAQGIAAFEQDKPDEPAHPTNGGIRLVEMVRGGWKRDVRFSGVRPVR